MGDRRRRGVRVLLLYWRPAGEHRRAASADHLHAVRAGASRAQVCLFNAVGGAPHWLARFRPDAIVLHTSFLATRWLTPFERWRERSGWIGGLDVPVLAFPQDDYDCAYLLDEWLSELGTTDVFTSLPDGVASLYPTRAGGARFHAVLTGYLSDRTVRAAGAATSPISSRTTDVVYRATALPYRFGAHGQLKAALGRLAREEARDRGLVADISTRPEDVISGPAWLRFLASGRIAIGCEGGSSAIDRRGELRAAVEQMLRRDPALSFEQADAGLPTGWDADAFTALSPRHLEAAAAGTAQVLVSGAYSGVLESGLHYIPVRRDLADLGEALMHARDPVALQEIADRTFEEVVASGRVHSDRLSEQIEGVLGGEGQGSDVARTVIASLLVRVAGSALAWRKPGALAARARGWLRRQIQVDPS